MENPDAAVRERAPAVQPVDLRAPGHGDTRDDDLRDPIRVALGVGEDQCGPPGAAEQQPLVDVQVPAQPLDVGKDLGCEPRLDDVVVLTLAPPAVRHLRELLGAAHHSLAVQEARDQVEVVSRCAHRHGEGLHTLDPVRAGPGQAEIRPFSHQRKIGDYTAAEQAYQRILSAEPAIGPGAAMFRAKLPARP